MEDNWNYNVYFSFNCIFHIEVKDFLDLNLNAQSKKKKQWIDYTFYKNISKLRLQNIQIHHWKIIKFAKYCAHLRFIPKRVTIFVEWYKILQIELIEAHNFMF